MDQFHNERNRLKHIVSRYAGRGIRKFHGLDAEVYGEGALPRKTKELPGLMASLVLRCDGCVRYHLGRCHEEGVTDAELEEAFVRKGIFQYCTKTQRREGIRRRRTKQNWPRLPSDLARQGAEANKKP